MKEISIGFDKARVITAVENTPVVCATVTEQGDVKPYLF